jgi:hypothetical protein
MLPFLGLKTRKKRYRFGGKPLIMLWQISKNSNGVKIVFCDLFGAGSMFPVENVFPGE